MGPMIGRARTSLLALALVIVAGCGGASATTPGSGPATNESPSRTPAATPSPSPAAGTTPPTTVTAAKPCLNASSTGPFLGSTGASFTCLGHPVALTGFTFYPALLGGAKAWHKPTFSTYIDRILDMGAAAGQNLIRPTDQWDSSTKGQTADDPVVWSNMDYLLSAAARRGVFVVVDLSSFRWLLKSQGLDPANTVLWTAFATTVATRYRNNPAVAFYSIAGEPAPPANSDQLKKLADFYSAVAGAVRAVDPNHLIAAGGFNHMEDHPEVGWWQAIDALPNIDIVAIKTYSQHDLDLMPAIAAYGRTAGKPVMEEEFGMPQGYGDASFAGGTAYNGLSAGRGPFFDSVYRTGLSLGFAGFVFWNMGCQMGQTSYEISPLTPAVWSVVSRYGAVPPTMPGTDAASLCS